MTNEEKLKELIRNATKEELEKYAAQPAVKFSPYTDADGEYSRKAICEDQHLDGAYKGYDMGNQCVDIPFKDRDAKKDFIKSTIDMVGRQKDLQATAGGGSYIVPEFWQDTIMRLAEESGFVLRDAKTVQMKSDVLYVPKETAKPSVYWSSEGETISAGDPTIGQTKLDCTKRLAGLTRCNNELLMDSNADVVGYIADTFARAISYEIDDEAVNSGENYFDSILDNAGLTVSMSVTGGGTNITHTDISGMIAQLTNPLLKGSKFYFNKAILNKVRLLEDSSGKLLFEPGMNGVNTLWTFPVYNSDVLPSAPAAGGNPVGFFGNLRNSYVVGIRKGSMQLDVDPFSYFHQLKTQFRIYVRMAAKMVLPNGVVVLDTQ